MNLTSDPDFLRSASTAEIALSILRRLGNENQRCSGYNEMNRAVTEFGTEPDRALLVGRIGDAWAWLVAHECVGQEHDSSGYWQRVTRRGAEIAASPVAEVQLQAERLLSDHLSPELQTSAQPAFARGQYDVAIFAAMRAVEVKVRELSGLPAGLLGVALMQEAFKRQGGKLTDPDAEGGEQEAIMSLFKGAIGAFKNPTSHRAVEFEDPIEAAEIVQLADLLLRLLRRTASPSADVADAPAAP